MRWWLWLLLGIWVSGVPAFLSHQRWFIGLTTLLGVACGWIAGFMFGYEDTARGRR